MVGTGRSYRTEVLITKAFGFEDYFTTAASSSPLGTSFH
jgi:hypothetical protein